MRERGKEGEGGGVCGADARSLPKGRERKRARETSQTKTEGGEGTKKGGVVGAVHVVVRVVLRVVRRMVLLPLGCPT